MAIVAWKLVASTYSTSRGGCHSPYKLETENRTVGSIDHHSSIDCKQALPRLKPCIACTCRKQCRGSCWFLKMVAAATFLSYAVDGSGGWHLPLCSRAPQGPTPRGAGTQLPVGQDGLEGALGNLRLAPVMPLPPRFRFYNLHRPPSFITPRPIPYPNSRRLPRISARFLTIFIKLNGSGQPSYPGPCDMGRWLADRIQVLMDVCGNGPARRAGTGDDIFSCIFLPRISQ